MADAADDDLVDYDDDDVVDQAAADDKDAKKGHYVGTCVEINECRVHDNSSRSHVASMAWSRCDSARTRRKNLISTQVPSRLEAALAAMDTDNDGHVDIDEWCVSELYNLGCLRRGDDALR